LKCLRARFERCHLSGSNFVLRRDWPASRTVLGIDELTASLCQYR
jgi:hypothetical protein